MSRNVGTIIIYVEVVGGYMLPDGNYYALVCMTMDKQRYGLSMVKL